MDPPSSGSQPSAGGINQMAFCHECGIEIRPLMTPDPTCPRCNGQFVEIIDQGTASHPSDFFDDPDDDDDFPFQPMHPHTGRAGPAPSLAFGAPPAGQGLGGLLMALASGAARAQEGANRAQQPSSSGAQPDSGQGPRSPDSESQSATRSGSTSFGPFGLQWNVQYGSGGGDPYQRAAQQQQQQQQQQEMRTPPTLSNFLRFAFGADTTGERMQQPDDEHVHDDGMGGAGSAADGRRFNHDNRGTGTYHQPPQSPQARTDELPPELAALRNLFTGLFGEPGAPGGGGGSLLDVLAAGAHGGPRGQWGDYVLGQQGLDDIISQLMEQTQGSNAPPPATDEVIEKLERFTRADTERIKRAKNQDCPTCKDDFLPTPGEEKQEGEETDQQDELVSMPCAHIFHEDCLVPWLRLHGTCPVCRVSIAKPRGEGDAGAPGGSTDAARGDAQEGAAADAAATVPGGWPSPPNPFSAFFNTAFGSGNGNGNGNTLSGSGNGYGNGSGNGNGNGNVGGDARVSHDSRGATTTTFQTQPPASTTITSTVYPSPPATAGGTSSGVEVNAIVSSPPLVDDRDDFFPPQQEGESRDAMRDRIRRATEARMGEPTLEPDELD